MSKLIYALRVRIISTDRKKWMKLNSLYKNWFWTGYAASFIDKLTPTVNIENEEQKGTVREHSPFMRIYDYPNVDKSHYHAWGCGFLQVILIPVLGKCRFCRDYWLHTPFYNYDSPCMISYYWLLSNSVNSSTVLVTSAKCSDIYFQDYFPH